jgi:hypothetical protein
LDVAQRDAGVEGGGDEGMAQGMRADLLIIQVGRWWIVIRCRADAATSRPA